MKQILLIELIIPISIFILLNSNNSFAENYQFKFEGKKYEIVTKKLSWTDASMDAVKQGGFLVHIDSQAEQDTIWKAIVNGAKIPKDYKVVSDGGGIAYIWIGATDQYKEGEWIWDGDNNGKGVKFWTGQGKNGKNDGQVVGNAFVYWGGISKNGTANEPDNFAGTQNAAAIALEPWPKNMGFLGIAGEWNDINPANQLYYIIEYDETTSIVPNTEQNYCIKECCDNLFASNPFGDLLTIHLKSNDFSRLSIFDIHGREMLSRKIDNQLFTISTSNFPNGIYILTLENNNSITTKVLIKI